MYIDKIITLKKNLQKVLVSGLMSTFGSFAFSSCGHLMRGVIVIFKWRVFV